ncbi:MAG: citramalate synthase [Desulfovibrio sp.]
MLNKKVTIYDTTLRDGTQAEEISLTSTDKIKIAQRLDALGVHYIEGGWPSSNQTDAEFFREVKNYSFTNAKITAFGSTHLARFTPETDKSLAALIKAKPDAITIFGKTWDFHATTALGISLERNLEIIYNSLAYLRQNVEELFFDGEHFFDGFKENKEYALQCLKKAHEAGAEVLVLCDTNGGTLPQEVAEITRACREYLPEAKFGIHAHNDCELAVANSLAAVKEGATMVQGTINGYGERAGNANLCSIIPNLELKMGYDTIGKEKMKELTTASHYVSEIANLRPFMRQPYVGCSAFAHKGGVHVSAILKDPRTYEHITPGSVGNVQKVLLSDLAGKSNIMKKARSYGYMLDKEDPAVMDLLTTVKDRESRGYDYSVAEASFEILFFKTMGWSKRYFQHINYRVLDSVDREGEPFSEATVMLKVRGQIEHTASTGDGPVNALDKALRGALQRAYPNLATMKLMDFKVRVMSGAVRDTGGTASYVRVLIESGDAEDRWTTVGVSHNIIEASWQALVDSINYKLFKDDPQKWPSQEIKDEEESCVGSK